MTVHIQQHKPSFSQTLLQNNASAAFLNGQLSETEWRVSDVSGFLSKASEDQRPTGSAYTWRDVFNETDQAIQTISSFMEVSVLVQDASKNSTKIENQYSKTISSQCDNYVDKNGALYSVHKMPNQFRMERKRM